MNKGSERTYGYKDRGPDDNATMWCRTAVGEPSWSQTHSRTAAANRSVTQAMKTERSPLAKGSDPPPLSASPLYKAEFTTPPATAKARPNLPMDSNTLAAMSPSAGPAHT